MDRVTNIAWKTIGGTSLGGATYYPLMDIQGTAWGYVDTQNNVVARSQGDVWDAQKDILCDILGAICSTALFLCRERKSAQ